MAKSPETVVWWVDDIHMRLQADIGGHGGANGIGAAGDGGAAMHLVDLHDRGIGVIKRGCGFCVLIQGIMQWSIPIA
jgi:hypothetical protein